MIEIRLDRRSLERLRRAVENAVDDTMGALLTDVREAQVIPFDTGALQSGGTYSYVKKNGSVREGATVPGLEATTKKSGTTFQGMLSVTGPQARRLYANPEYDFQTGNNPNARGDWFSPWIDGERKKYIAETLTKTLREEMKK